MIPAAKGTRWWSAPRVGDAMLVGYFEAVDTGSTAKRLVLGFGSGAADLGTAVEGYVMTEHGPRLLGSGKIGSRGGKTPGLLIPLVVVATTANPLGLIVVGAAKVQGELTGRTKIEGAAKLAPILPATKVARYIQIENKIRALVRFELADKIPLVK